MYNSIIHHIVCSTPQVKMLLDHNKKFNPNWPHQIGVYFFSHNKKFVDRQLSTEVQGFNNAPRDPVVTFLTVKECLLFQALPSMSEEFWSGSVPIYPKRTSSLSNLLQMTSLYFSQSRQDYICLWLQEKWRKQAFCFQPLQWEAAREKGLGAALIREWHM